MKYIKYVIILIIFLFITMFPFNLKKDNSIKIAEVTHSIFYTPLYVAKNNNYFKKEGLNVEIILTAGADKVTAAVLSGDVQIGLCGSEATVYLYNQGLDDYLINFAGLTKRDGSFIVSRKKYDEFKLEDLKDSTIIGGRQGGMPEMILKWSLNKNGIDPINDLYIDTSIQFSAMSGAFIGGTGDFVTLFEPNALELEKQGYGYIVKSVGELSGVIPYTAFNTKKSYIDNNKDTLIKFVNAIQKGLDYVHNNNSKDIAYIIKEEFPDLSIEDLILLIDRYKNIDAWYDTTYINESDYNHLIDIINYSNNSTYDYNYSKLVTNFSKKE